MKTTFIVASCVFAFSAFATDINLKPGVYEISTTVLINGKKYDPLADLEKQMKDNPGMKQMVEKMSSAEKAKFLEGLKSSTKSDLTTVKHCIKKENLKADKILQGLNDDEDCNYTATKKTGNEVIGTVSCEAGTKGTSVFKTNSNESYTYVFEGTFFNRKNSKVISNGKFISHVCPKELLDDE